MASTQTSAHAEMDLDVQILETDAAAKPPLTRRWTRWDKERKKAKAQTSAHAEMDLLHPPPNLSTLANLRSRGDGPPRNMEQQACHCKPPLTRRWTLAHSMYPAPCRQTSAHAEMDPCFTTRRGAKCSNLRSRGDGPIDVNALDGSSAKPPLTRRWTGCGRPPAGTDPQTSAHAEMDQVFVRENARKSANLRSRGDGPRTL